ncbi:hypothetical protein Gocc_2632 [Gaiella occulta]|uniref:Uncharacterized protein n=1 Tax=Gaiella occulta TaxID=1002870 RepID=A0A7M2YVW3_9ACTN|nr:hypothetical protein [Gaiella occulta]RDI73719.1 hypothetical protein Gocc_2632 [Gaiella occulta]
MAPTLHPTARTVRERLLRTIDDSLHRFERVWCAAGTPHAVFDGVAELTAAVAP